jgi:hypothetical protein
MNIERPRERCGILGLIAIDGPIAWKDGRLPLAGESVEVGGEARDSRGARLSRWTRNSRGARDGWAIDASLMFGLDGGTEVVTMISGC